MRQSHACHSLAPVAFVQTLLAWLNLHPSLLFPARSRLVCSSTAGRHLTGEEAELLLKSAEMEVDGRLRAHCLKLVIPLGPQVHSAGCVQGGKLAGFCKFPGEICVQQLEEGD